jgi:hypothetical protein
MRLLVLLLLLALVAWVIWSLWQRAQSRAASEGAAGRYRVVERTTGSDAQVFIGSGGGNPDVLIGSVNVASEDFDERYAELVVRAEDRAATLNASRELHAEP